jgi:RNase P subunit RPR2
MSVTQVDATKLDVMGHHHIPVGERSPQNNIQRIVSTLQQHTNDVEVHISSMKCDICDQCKRLMPKGRQRVNSDGYWTTYCPQCAQANHRRSSLSTEPIAKN